MAEVDTRQPDGNGGTLGGQIADQIERDMRIKGWREGHLIGAEVACHP